MRDILLAFFLAACGGRGSSPRGRSVCWGPHYSCQWRASAWSGAHWGGGTHPEGRQKYARNVESLIWSRDPVFLLLSYSQLTFLSPRVEIRWWWLLRPLRTPPSGLDQPARAATSPKWLEETRGAPAKKGRRGELHRENGRGTEGTSKVYQG